MKLKIANNAQKGPGHAILTATETGIAPVGLKLRIESRNSKPFLGTGGWQESDTVVAPSGARIENGALVIFIDPDIVGHLRPATYKISLIGADGETASSRISSNDILMPPTRQCGPRAGATAVQREAASETISALDRVSRQPAGTDEPSAPEATVEPPVCDPQRGKSGSGKMVLVMILIAMLVAAGGGYFAYTNFTDRGDAAEVAANERALTTESPSAPAASEENLMPMDQAKKFLAGGPSGPEMVARARKFWQDGHGEPGFLVMSRAAKEGYGLALLEMGQVYDPAFDGRPEADGMPEPRGDIAYNYYRQASQLGASGADDAIARLKSWAENAATEGDRSASALIRLLTMNK